MIALAIVIVIAAAPPPPEPAGLARHLKAATADDATAALADPALETCRGTWKKMQGIDTLPCRLAVVAAHATATAATRPVAQTGALVADVMGTAAWVSAYTATAPSPGLRRARLEAHKQACGIVFGALESLRAVPHADPRAADAAALIAGTAGGTSPLREQACSCAQRTASLAVGADASPGEQAEIQGLLTINKCFLAANQPGREPPKGPDGLSLGSAATQDLAASASPAGRLVAMAEGRAVELRRCTDKGVENGAISDGDKLTRCACNTVKRWALPLQKTDPRVQADLPLAPGIILPVTVDNGAIGECGPARAAP